jgi:hypothetical protein
MEHRGSLRSSSAKGKESENSSAACATHSPMPLERGGV